MSGWPVETWRPPAHAGLACSIACHVPNHFNWLEKKQMHKISIIVTDVIWYWYLLYLAAALAAAADVAEMKASQAEVAPAHMPCHHDLAPIHNTQIRERHTAYMTKTSILKHQKCSVTTYRNILNYLRLLFNNSGTYVICLRWLSKKHWCCSAEYSQTPWWQDQTSWKTRLLSLQWLDNVGLTDRMTFKPWRLLIQRHHRFPFLNLSEIQLNLSNSGKLAG